MHNSAIKLTPDLRWVQIENAIFILDLRRGEYSALGPEHLDAWLAFAGVGHSSTVPPQALVSLQETLEKRGWLSPSQAPCPVPVSRQIRSRKHFRTALATVWLSRCMISLRLLGFARTYRTAQQSAFHTASAGDIADLDRALAAFERAEALFFSRKGLEDCLPRSLALFAYLRRCGLPATHHMGVRRYPFHAHAWVECHGMRLQCAITHGKVQRGSASGLPDFTNIAVLG